jgi:Flp pilus assembly pilin Flp
LRGSENGQTTVEYALITALVIALAVVSFTALSSSILTFFTNLVAQVGAIGS